MIPCCSLPILQGGEARFKSYRDINPGLLLCDRKCLLELSDCLGVQPLPSLTSGLLLGCLLLQFKWSAYSINKGSLNRYTKYNQLLCEPEAVRRLEGIRLN